MKMTKKIRLVMLAAAAILALDAPAQESPHAAVKPDSGTVVETMDSGGYTYARIEINGEKTWFAAPTTTLKVGDKVTAAAGLPMKDFYSKTLDRTFDVIYFVGAISKVGAKPAQAKLPAGHPSLHSSVAQTGIPEDIDLSGIKPLKDGKTVAEIYAAKDQLAGKTIRVRGKAVKVSNAIMGKNWIHLRDGTGIPGSNDLTITTSASAEPGQLIVVEGKVARNLDFGFGYKYDILLEDAAVTVEP